METEIRKVATISQRGHGVSIPSEWLEDTDDLRELDVDVDGQHGRLVVHLEDQPETDTRLRTRQTGSTVYVPLSPVLMHALGVDSDDHLILRREAPSRVLVSQKLSC